MKVQAHTYAFAVALVGLVGIIVLASLHVAIPQVLQDVTLAALVGGAGLAYPASPPAP